MARSVIIPSICSYRDFWIPALKTRDYSRIISLALALIVMTASVTVASDTSGVLETKDQRAKEVMTRPTISRVSKLPRLPVNLRQYEFLLDHPHLSMVLARIYDPSLDSYKVDVKPNGLVHVDDPAGLAGDMEVINSISGRRVYFVTGHFDLLKMRVYGHVVLSTLYYEHHDEVLASVDSTTTSYIKVNSAFVGFFAKVVALLFPKKVDERISRFANAVRKVTFAVHNDPTGAYTKLVATGQVSSRELKEFARVFLRKA